MGQQHSTANSSEEVKIYEGAELKSRIKANPDQFLNQPCEIIRSYSPAQADGKHSRSLQVFKGEEGKIVQVRRDTTKGILVRIVIASRLMKTDGTISQRDGWVPLWTLRIATGVTYGDFKVFYQGLELKPVGFAELPGQDNSRIAKAVRVQLQAYYENREFLQLQEAFTDYLSTSSSPGTTRQILKCIQAASPGMLTALNKAGVSWTDVRDGGPGWVKGRNDETTVREGDKDLRPQIYGILYWDFESDRPGRQRVYIYVGVTECGDERNGSHIQASKVKLKSNHYKIRRKARQIKMVPLAVSASGALRNIMEQVFVDLFQSSCFGVLRQEDDAELEFDEEDFDGDDDDEDEMVAAADSAEYAESEVVTTTIADTTVAPVTDAEQLENVDSAENMAPGYKRNWANDKAIAIKFAEVARAAREKSGWRGLAGIFGGCNWKSPLVDELTFGALVWMQQVLPNGFKEIRRTAKSTTLINGAISIAQFREGESVTTIASTIRDVPPKARVNVVFEFSPSGMKHPRRWLNTPLDGPMSDWPSTQELAIRVEYRVADGSKKDKNGKPVMIRKAKYLKKVDSNKIQSDEVGAYKGYADGGAVVRYFKQQRFPRGALVPTYFKDFGVARLSEAKWEHMKHAWYVTDLLPSRQRTPVPTALRIQQVDNLHLAKTTTGLAGMTTIQDFGAFTSIRGKPTKYCDRCIDILAGGLVTNKMSGGPCVSSGERGIARCTRCRAAGGHCLVTALTNIQNNLPYVQSIRGDPMGYRFTDAPTTDPLAQMQIVIPDLEVTEREA